MKKSLPKLPFLSTFLTTPYAIGYSNLMLIDYTHLKNNLSWHQALGLFSYYSQWRSNISDSNKPLIMAAIKNLKEEIANALLHVTEENILLVVKTDISVALNQPSCKKVVSQLICSTFYHHHRSAGSKCHFI